GNAVKFTEKGAVTLDAHPIRATEADVTLRLSVKDTGIGIPKELQAAVFESFTQLDGRVNRKSGGTGLGLAICRHLAHLMGGTIGLESEPGSGSTFWIELTLEKARPPDARAEVPGRPTGAWPAEPDGLEGAERAKADVANLALRILVAEDNEVNREVVLRMIAKWGCRADAVADGHGVLEALEQGPYDLVLMDVQMPEMDGL